MSALVVVFPLFDTIIHLTERLRALVPLRRPD